MAVLAISVRPFELIYLPEVACGPDAEISRIQLTRISVTGHFDRYRVSINVFENAPNLGFFPRSARSEARVREESYGATSRRSRNSLHQTNQAETANHLPSSGISVSKHLDDRRRSCRRIRPF